MAALSPHSGRKGRPALLASFLRSPLAVFAAVLLVVLVAGAMLAPWVALTNPYDLATLDLMNSRMPPYWEADGQWPFILGTDNQGGDILSLILYGLRTSLAVGCWRSAFRSASAPCWG